MLSDFETTKFSQIVEANKGTLVGIKHIEVSFVRSLFVAEFTWGWLIGAEMIDDEGETLVETLTTVDREVAILVGRDYTGDSDNFFCREREAKFSIGSKVNLLIGERV